MHPERKPRPATGKPARSSPKSKPKAPPEIKVRASWCKGCGLCVDYCNRGVLEMDGVLPRVKDIEKCSRCLQCEAICPDFAIEVNDGEIEAVEGPTDEAAS